jgi:proline iminopeptidase
MKLFLQTLFLVLFISACNTGSKQEVAATTTSSYLTYSKEDKFTGGVKMVPIKTPKGEFRVWTKRVGNNPKMKVLLLHGGPGGTHEFFECFDGYLPEEGIEYIYYDQLESYYSDQPNDSTLWTTEHFVEEVEQVRQALGLNKDNFYLLGQSWGGTLAMEYALKYQDNLKGLIISNMMSSIPEYNKYAQEVLGPQMDPAVLKEIKDMEAKGDFSNPKYEALITEHYYTKHVLRMPVEKWPEPVMRAFKHLSKGIYVYMQGYSEFGVTGNASLKNWDRSKDLVNITVPTLVIGATNDTMDPKHMEWMSKQVKKGRFLLCPNGSHLSQFDDQENYIGGVIKFVKDVDHGSF